MKKINIKPLQLILAKYPEKKAQLEKVMDITYHLTSDYGCTLKSELYNNNIARYIIEGTRSQFTICFNAISMEICRKPRNEKAWFSMEENNIFMDKIIK